MKIMHKGGALGVKNLVSLSYLNTLIIVTNWFLTIVGNYFKTIMN